MKIAVTFQNLSKIASFAPVEGRYSCSSSDELNENPIPLFEAIRRESAVVFPVRIELFDGRGHAMNGDLSTDGTFLITRSRTNEEIL